MCSSSIRLAKLRERCADEGWDAFYVRNTSNIRWLTDFDDVFDEEQAHALFVDGKQALLHTDSRYVTACEQAAVLAGNVVKVDASVRSHAKVVLEQAAGMTCMAIEDSISLGEFRRLDSQREESEARGLHFAETDGVIVGLRAVKDTGEVERLKGAQAITDAAFSYIITCMKPGMTEWEVQLELDDYMLRHGAEGLAFPSIVATGPHGASPHAIPGNTKLEAGQCVVMDFGARARGYCSDMTRTVFLGNPEGEMLQAWNTMREANETVEAMLRPGITGKQAHESAEEILAQGGFEGKMGHGLGHGVGIDIHEEPVLSRRNERPLEAGNVVTVEPGIYLPGKFGMRLEDFGIITETGYDVFTQSTHDLVVL